MANLAYYNGNYSPLESLMIPALDRAVYFGDGVYEATYFRGGKVFGMADHLDRLENSLRLVGVPMPMDAENGQRFTRASLETMLRGLAARLGGEGILYWQITRGTAPRVHSWDPAIEPNLLAWAKHKTPADGSVPMKLKFEEDRRYRFCNVKTLNLILNVMAAQDAEQSGCDEAVFVRDGVVTEGAHTNMHILKDGALITHPLDDTILPGTVRRQLLRVCGKLGVPVIERTFTPDEMLAADEVLITSATTFVRFADTLSGKAVGGKDAALRQKLQAGYLADIDAELAAL